MKNFLFLAMVIMAALTFTAAPPEVRASPLHELQLRPTSLTNMLNCDGQVGTITVSGTVRDTNNTVIPTPFVELDTTVNGDPCHYQITGTSFGEYTINSVFHAGYILTVTKARFITFQNYYNILTDPTTINVTMSSS